MLFGFQDKLSATSLLDLALDLARIGQCDAIITLLNTAIPDLRLEVINRLEKSLAYKNSVNAIS